MRRVRVGEEPEELTRPEAVALLDASRSLPSRHCRTAPCRPWLEAKFWLDPVTCARNLGFATVELSRIERPVVEHAAELDKGGAHSEGHSGTFRLSRPVDIEP